MVTNELNRKRNDDSETMLKFLAASQYSPISKHFSLSVFLLGRVNVMKETRKFQRKCSPVILLVWLLEEDKTRIIVVKSVNTLNES